MKSERDNIASIQFLRAIAALGVVMMHNFYFFDYYSKTYHVPKPAMESWYHVKTIGGIGVDIFFVISGFIMAHLAERNPGQSFNSFFGRRLTRIVPIFWVVTAFWLWWDPNKEPLYIVKSFLFIPVREVMPLTGVGWTLNYEMFFYLVFGVIVVAMRRSIWWIAAAFIGFAVWSKFSHSYVIHFYGNPIIWNFFAGLVVHRVYRNRVVLDLSPLIFAASIGSIVFWAVAWSPRGGWDPVTVMRWGPSSALLVLSAVSLEASGLMRRVFNMRPMQALGASSYSLYLIHNIAFASLNLWIFEYTPILRYLGADLSMLLLIACACVCAQISYRLIERPTQWLLRPRRRVSAPIEPKGNQLYS